MVIDSKRHHQKGETMQITTRTGTYYSETDPMTIIEATQDGQLISELYADITTGQIMQIWTAEDRRREGIATALLAFAEENGIELYHSPQEHCTPEGLAFAEATDDIEIISEDMAYQPA